MTAKEHYDHFLSDFYSWMTGDFDQKQKEQQQYFLQNNIVPQGNKIAFDLGAGHGLQSVSLAKLGFVVTAVDFNLPLLRELRQNKKDLPINIVHKDILHCLENTEEKAELIVCMGDTLTHLENLEQVNKLAGEMFRHLLPEGKMILSFRDLTTALTGEQRFIPVKEDETKILTCFLEYFPDHVMVHDILHVFHDGHWIQKVSAYPKLRLNEKLITEILTRQKFSIISIQNLRGMVHIVALKPN
jgi:2-polyprenyl-3-methyl-5-hydroxy-6-metoxy-1,4-benzoquinol methylase